MKTCNDIRSEFIRFFQEREHAFVPSSPLLPADDPTLLFTNAGMNQFKDIFLGQSQPPWARAANSQKCIRAGGKHNDLEDVGHDTYHHTFFEMLGNWSFGDYFKADAIKWAWQLLTEVWGLPRERLHVTVFGGDEADGLAADDEARKLWQSVTDVDPAHIHTGSKDDNFWEMGETGPCGPCSEIHYDFTPDLSGGPLVNVGDSRVMEIWNLVFIQFNRGADGKLTPLPAKHVDTGMGLERIARILQGVGSNYDIDVFQGLFRQIRALGASEPYTASMDAPGDIAYRVIADHARTLTFAIADGVMPSNEGRGYVIRRILRRACRYGRQNLAIEGTFLHKLVGAIVEAMGEAFPEIAQRQDRVAEVIGQEEEAFGRTLDRGIELFQRQASRLAQAGQKVLPGETAFELYATYGFPVDLTQIMAGEAGLTVDLPGFQERMEHHRQVSAGDGGKFKADAVVGLPATDDSSKYDAKPVTARVLGWVVEGRFVSEGTLSAGQQAAVVLDRTSFYGEQGGQVGDCGRLNWPGGLFEVADTAVAGESVLHVGQVTAGELSVGQEVTGEVDQARLETMRNHTATHLLNWALREVLGDESSQAGSVVAPERLRFDFTHGSALSDEQLRRVELLVNERVLADEAVSVKVMPLGEARKLPGVRAVFGERYPDPVRVVAAGRSAEFCGGTHLQRTGQVGLFKIISEESVAKGVRRITALTGRAALSAVQEAWSQLQQAAGLARVGPVDLPGRIEAMQSEIRQLRKRPTGGAGGAEAFSVAHEVTTSAGRVVIGVSPVGDPAHLRGLCDVQRQRGAAAVLVAAAEEGKVTLVAMVDDAVAKAGRLKAGDWVKSAAAAVGGGGGGKATLAQAGGKQPENLPAALEDAANFARAKLE